MAYCTLAQVKAYLGGFEDAGQADDALLTDMIQRAQAMIDRYTHRTFEAPTDTTRRFDAVRDVGSGSRASWPYGGATMALARADARLLYFDEDCAQISVVLNGDGSLVPPAAYVTMPANRTPFYGLFLTASSGLAWTYSDAPENAIQVTGRWAYSVVAPADVEHACIRLTAWLYKQGQSYDPALDRPMVATDGILRMPMTLPQDVTALLAPYRKASVA